MSRTRCPPMIVWALVALPQFLPLANGKAPLYKATSNRMPGHYIVVFKDGVDTDYAINSVMDSAGGQLNEDFVFYKYRMLINGFCARLSEESLSKIIESDMVAYIEEDQMAYLDTLASWGLDRVDQRDLPLNNDNRNYIGDGTNVHIYVIDSGVRYSHPDFAGRTGDRYDFIEKSPDVGKDCHGHGTHVAGTAAGSTYGVATGAIVHDVRVFSCLGYEAFVGAGAVGGGILAGMEWVAENHAKPAVASMSVGVGVSQALNDATQTLFDLGVVVVVAAANEYADACLKSPASAPVAITVGATTIEDNKVDFSNFGKCIDIFAPGVAIPSANIASDSEPRIYSGTSMACPHVSGAAAILLGIDLTLTPQEVTDLLLGAAARNKVEDAHFMSQNRLLYIGVETCMIRCGSSVDDSRTCQCDADCSSRGDCCDDYSYLCWEKAPTCSGRCGDGADEMTYPCQCDEACFSRVDCCQDHVILCKPNIPCDSIHDHRGLYYSPYYPDAYLNDQTCHALIKIPDKYNHRYDLAIVFTFVSFNLEQSPSCSADSLTIHDGDDEGNTILGKFCGTEVQSPLLTNGRSATVVFRTDSIGTRSGYSFEISFDPVVEVTAPGSISSTNFPSNYPNNAHVITRIFAPPGEQIVLTFTHFDLEGLQSGLCLDTLSFYDSDTLLQEKLLGSECTDGINNIAKFSPLKSTGSSMTLRFKSDTGVTRSGYHATVTSIKPCNSVLTRPTTITSSNYPSGYYNNDKSYTEIQTSCGKQVVVTFTDFELETPSLDGVCLDYLKIYEGDVPDDKALIGTFCGSGAPQVRSIGGKLLFEFASDWYSSAKGYNADVNFLQAVTVRLVDGKTPSEGRVEIEHNKFGKGGVCDNNWDIKDASVVCKMLGYGAAKDARHRSYFGEGIGQVLLDDVRCSGSEFNIDQCQHSSWKPGTCSYRQDASAICYQKGEVPLPVRLRDGDVLNAGRVELRIGDEWGTICGNNWDLIDAEVVCKGLGYRGAEKVLNQGEVTPGDPTFPIFFGDVKCDGDENGIEFCCHSGVGNHNCDRSNDVGVHCIAD